jgi:hypothetical protein
MSATPQFAYGCRAPGCDQGFLTTERRDAHEISAHGYRAELQTEAPRVETQLAGGVRVDAPVTDRPDAIALIDEAFGPDDPEKETTMDDAKIACPKAGCDREFRNQHGLDVHVARSHKTAVGGGIGVKPPEKPKPAPARKHPAEVGSASANGKVTISRERAEQLRDLVFAGTVGIYTQETLHDAEELRGEAKRLELLAILREATG